jgi:DNA-binding transcriptional LysR family regulator
MAFDSRLLSGLSVVAAVIDAGNFARAGERLHLSQSGVSRSIQRLEERVGVRLFERTSKSMRLTDEGKAFCTEVLPLLSRLEEVTEATAHASQVVRGRLRVNVDPTFARMVLAPSLGVLLKAQPGLQIDLVVRDRLGDMVAEGFEVAVRLGHPDPSALIARRLLQYRILTCASPKYLAEHGRPRAPQDLKHNHECIHFSDPLTGRPFPWEFHRGRKIVTVPVQGRLVVNDAQVHLESCLSGHGVAQLLELSSQPFLKIGQLVNLFPDWSNEFFPLYSYHVSRHLVPLKVRLFLDFIALQCEHSSSR